jgi:electron transport complex protein RnfB
MKLADAVAVIDERYCIGCTLCIQACPVDAIVGAAKYMHTVIADRCTGCELCITPCPVDCISMQPLEARDAAARAAAEADMRRRSAARRQRLERERDEKAAKLASRRDTSAERRKRETIARAIERARQRLGKK